MSFNQLLLNLSRFFFHLSFECVCVLSERVSVLDHYRNDWSYFHNTSAIENDNCLVAEGRNGDFVRQASIKLKQTNQTTLSMIFWTNLFRTILFCNGVDGRSPWMVFIVILIFEMSSKLNYEWILEEKIVWICKPYRVVPPACFQWNIFVEWDI